MYKIKEIYYTLQGEGQQVGRASVFCRFTGCNLWSGRDDERSKAICQFCDTDFVGMDGLNGGAYDEVELAKKIDAIWVENTKHKGSPFVVFTGGEPLLQLDKKLVVELKKMGFDVAIETNGTLPIPCDLDWICVSPKANTEIVLKEGNELKMVYPQSELNPLDFENLDFDHFYIQPMDGDNQKSNIDQSIQYCLSHPKWKLSMQMHKLVNIP